MSDIKLFSLCDKGAKELASHSAKLEKDLQAQIEHNMEVLLGIRFLATEHDTGSSHNGRIDSLGLDENNCPVIIEYKRDRSSALINQGLFYLDWLQKNPADFRWLVMEKFGRDTAESIEWNGARLLCIAADFPKYDLYAVEQINANIELIRYRYFGYELLLLELVNARSKTITKQTPALKVEQGLTHGLDGGAVSRKSTGDKSQQERLDAATPELCHIFNDLCDFTQQLGDDVQRKDLKLYTAFKRLKNFISIVIMPGKSDPKLQVYLKLPGTDGKGDGFSRNMIDVGHWGTGDFELNIRTLDDLDRAKSFVVQSYEQG